MVHVMGPLPLQAGYTAVSSSFVKQEKCLYACVKSAVGACFPSNVALSNLKPPSPHLQQIEQGPMGVVLHHNHWRVQTNRHDCSRAGQGRMREAGRGRMCTGWVQDT